MLSLLALSALLPLSASLPASSLDIEARQSQGGVAGGDGDQFWHLRYHHWIAMASYNDPDTFTSKCSDVFSNSSYTSLPTDGSTPFSLVGTWGPTSMGLQGFVAQVPVMDKIVLVIQEVDGWQAFNTTPSPAGKLATALNLGNSAADATAWGVALDMYLDARTSTNSWSLATDAVASSGHQFSVVGHGFAGVIAQIAALDFGWAGNLHYSHSMGAPRVFNKAAADIYDSLFQGQAGQRAVANNDLYPSWIPESDDYTMTLTGVHATTDSSSKYEMTLSNCYDANESECLGGNSEEDHWWYFTSPGECGDPTVYQQEASAVEASLSESMWWASHSSAASASSAAATATTSTPSPTTADPTGTKTGPTATSTDTTGGAARPWRAGWLAAALPLVMAALL